MLRGVYCPPCYAKRCFVLHVHEIKAQIDKDEVVHTGEAKHKLTYRCKNCGTFREFTQKELGAYRAVTGELENIKFLEVFLYPDEVYKELDYLARVFPHAHHDFELPAAYGIPEQSIILLIISGELNRKDLEREMYLIANVRYKKPVARYLLMDTPPEGIKIDEDTVEDKCILSLSEFRTDFANSIRR